MHRQLMNLVGTLNSIYRDNKTLWENDFSHEGFQWLDFEDRMNSVISFARYDSNRAEHLVCILNFTPQTLYNYKTGLPSQQKYEVLFSSDDPSFGGSGVSENRIYESINQPFAQASCHTYLTLPPLGGMLLKPIHSHD